MNRERLTQVLRTLLFREWGTKMTAIALALVVFIVTRDEIHRTFMLPLRVIHDPDRVLLTELPETISVEIRGPWQRLNRLGPLALGSATLDLDEAREGPLHIDPASIVMPSGVLLEKLEYDPVDLRFDPVIEQSLSIVPRIDGQVSRDHELVAIEVDPPVWRVRGGQLVVSRLEALSTTRLELSGATRDVETELALVRPDDAVAFVGVLADATPRVSVRVRVRARPGTRELSVPVLAQLSALVPGVDATRDGVPDHETVTIKGPEWALRQLDGIDPVLVPEIEVDKGADGTAVKLRFAWGPGVPEPIRSELSLEPGLVRFTIVGGREL